MKASGRWALFTKRLDWGDRWQLERRAPSARGLGPWCTESQEARSGLMDSGEKRLMKEWGANRMTQR